jgi:hypothetical protein
MKSLCLLTFGCHHGFIMPKRSKSKLVDLEVFRDSDFIGMDPRVQSQLSTSLNTLSQRVTAAMKTLAEVPKPADRSSSVDASPVEAPRAAPSPRRQGPGESGGTSA